MIQEYEEESEEESDSESEEESVIYIGNKPKIAKKPKKIPKKIVKQIPKKKSVSKLFLLNEINKVQEYNDDRIASKLAKNNEKLAKKNNDNIPMNIFKKKLGNEILGSRIKF